MQNIFLKLNSYFKGNWNVAVLDFKKGRWIVSADISNIPYLKAENSNGRHIIMQPSLKVEPYFLMVDDINRSTTSSHHKDTADNWKLGRMAVETSPGNYQVWIHSSQPLSLEEKRYWLKKMHNDPGADPKNRWGRCPGFRNRKEKHKDENGGYPLAKLIWIDWKNTADIPHPSNNNLDSMNTPLSPQPVRGVCQYEPITRSDYASCDESRTDFSCALALMRRGYSDADVSSLILNERTDWQNHTGKLRLNSYLNHTIKNARKLIENK